MSKIGRKPIEIPQSVEVKLNGTMFEAKGSKGTLSMEINPQIKLEITEKEIVVKKVRNTKESNAFWGLTRALLNNILIGVNIGYQKKLELQGVGFRMSISGKNLNLALGFSHPVKVEIPADLKVEVQENNVLSIFGIDKQKVGQFAAEIRSFKKVEPYKGKGFRYQDEKVRRKVGKKAGTAA